MCHTAPHRAVPCPTHSLCSVPKAMARCGSVGSGTDAALQAFSICSCSKAKPDPMWDFPTCPRVERRGQAVRCPGIDSTFQGEHGFPTRQGEPWMQDATESSSGVRVQKEVEGPENEAAIRDKEKALSAAWPLSEPCTARSRQRKLLGNVLLWK